MGGKRTNWGNVALKEKGAPRRKVFREWSRDHSSPNQFGQGDMRKADLKRMLEDAVKNTLRGDMDHTLAGAGQRIAMRKAQKIIAIVRKANES